MKTITIITITAITTTVIVYNFMRDDTTFGRLQALESQTGTISSRAPQNKLDQLASVLHNFQQINQKHFQQTQLQQARLHKMLADLNAKLRTVETAADEQTTDAIVLNDIEQTTDNERSNGGPGKSEDRKFSEADVGYWMDETLRVGWSQDSTI